MNYIKLKGEIVLLDNILHAEIKENTIEILYGINVPEQGNKFYGHVLDYSEVKNDVNEEKTKIEQDYEKLMYNLNVKDFDLVNKNVYESKCKLYEHELSQNTYLKQLLNKIEFIISGKGVNKIGRIKEVFKENGF